MQRDGRLKDLFLRAKDERKKEAELRRQAEEGRVHAEEARKRAEEGQKQVEEEKKRADEYIQQTTLLEFLCVCHDLLSLLLQVRTPSRSTKGKIPPPKGKYCPTQLFH